MNLEKSKESKMKPIYKVLSVAAIGFLIGCGGGSSSSGVSGVVEASYLKGVKVCVKGTDTCAITDENGKFSLNASAPVMLELKIGNSVLGDVNATTTNMTVTPAVLADNNSTIAAYVGTTLHKIAGCDVAAESCDLSNIKSVDVDPNSDEPIVEEIEKKVQNDENVTVTVDDNTTVEVSDEDVQKYKITNPMMTGETKLLYHGISVGEGILEFVIDINTLNLQFTLRDENGNVTEEGNATLSPVYKNVFFKIDNNDDEMAFVTTSFAMSVYVDDNALHYNFGVQYPQKELSAVDVEMFANKSYNAFTFDTTGGVEFSTIDINTTNPEDLNGTWSEGSISGTWEVEGDHVNFFYNGQLGAQAYVRAGAGRNTLVYATTDGDFGIGVEAKPLVESELKGTFYYDDISFENGKIENCFGYVTVDGTKFSYKDEVCNGAEQGSGTLELNPEVNGMTLNGIARVIAPDGTKTSEYVIMNPEDGYYIAVDADSGEVSIGSNKPIK